MAFSLVSSVAAAPGSTGGTTGAINTNGANLLIVVISDFGGASQSTLSDSESNTWNELTLLNFNSNARCTIYYAYNPNVGASHTFTYDVQTNFPTIMALAFSDADTAAPFDVENGAGVTGTSLQPGSVTPSENDELLICGLTTANEEGSTPSIDSSFIEELGIIFGTGVNLGGFTGYKIQTTAGAENPTWSWTTSVDAASVIATFKSTSEDPPYAGLVVNPLFVR